MENPDFVFTPWEEVYEEGYEGEKRAFQVIVPSGSRSFVFEHNKPIHFASLVPRNPNQKKDEYSPDVDAIVKWITGGPDGMRMPETDIYGVVQLSIDDLSNQIVEFAALADEGKEASIKKAKSEYKNAEQNFLKKVEESRRKAAVIADTKVKRALRTTHVNLMKQWEILEQDGKGRYLPSTAEALGTYILGKEIDKAGQKKKEMVERFMKTAPNISVL